MFLCSFSLAMLRSQQIPYSDTKNNNKYNKNRNSSNIYKEHFKLNKKMNDLNRKRIKQILKSHQRHRGSK